MKGILAGIAISIGAVANLIVGGYLGPFLFSIGLMSILIFDWHLFTGKAGLLVTKKISGRQLIKIWITNFIGCFIGASILALPNPQNEKIIAAARDIVLLRNQNSFFINLLMGIGCGVLMYIAVNGYKKTGNMLAFILPVSIFILSGYNHCIADMFYFIVGVREIREWLSLIPTTIGNIVGCCFIPMFDYLFSRSSNH